MSDEYRYRGRCDVCRETGPWELDDESAAAWLDEHFEDADHADLSQSLNSRVQRYPVADLEAIDA